MWIVDPQLADSCPEIERCSKFSKEGKRKQIHVGKRMLEAGRDKSSDRRRNREYSVDSTACAEAQPGRQTHQNVGQYPVDQCLKAGVACLGVGGGKRGHTN